MSGLSWAMFGQRVIVTKPPANVLANWPALTARSVAMLLLGDDGEEDDDPLHAVNNDASVAIDAAWQASPQKRRREMRLSVSDIALIAPVFFGAMRAAPRISERKN